MTQSSEQYAHTGGAQCPVCAHDELVGGLFYTDSGQALYDLRCPNCGSTWTARFALTGYLNLVEKPTEHQGLEIQRTLVISTAHLPVAHRRWLDGQTRPTLAAPHYRPTPILIVDAIGDYGWRICLEATGVEQYLGKHERDDALAVLLRYGQHHNCHWLALDRDGEEVDGLPTFED